MRPLIALLLHAVIPVVLVVLTATTTSQALLVRVEQSSRNGGVKSLSLKRNQPMSLQLLQGRSFRTTMLFSSSADPENKETTSSQSTTAQEAAAAEATADSSSSSSVVIPEPEKVAVEEEQASPPLDLPSPLLLASSIILAIVSVGSLFDLIGGTPTYGVVESAAVTLTGLPLCCFLFYAAILKGQAETEEDDEEYKRGGGL